MHNHAPIFVNGFQRGGTNILVNLIASHPEISTLGRETHEVFYGRKSEAAGQQWLRRVLHLPIVLSTRQHTFWPYRYYERRKIPNFLFTYMDTLFYWDKTHAKENKTHAFGKPRSKKVVADSRFVSKNVNGAVYTSEILAEIYPESTFIALVRNGFALCEGLLRRGWSAEKTGRVYQSVCKKMIFDSGHLKNYHFIQFEEMIRDPHQCAEKVYSLCHLDFKQVDAFRLNAKLSMSQDGSRQYTFGHHADELHWFLPDQLSTHLRQDVNENQINKLTKTDLDTFLSEARESMEYFGYL